jgi:hypothetical protein
MCETFLYVGLEGMLSLKQKSVGHVNVWRDPSGRLSKLSWLVATASIIAQQQCRLPWR